jgi:hypothetical protein
MDFAFGVSGEDDWQIFGKLECGFRGIDSVPF